MHRRSLNLKKHDRFLTFANPRVLSAAQPCILLNSNVFAETTVVASKQVPLAG